jgi:hypothetical protein
MSIFNHPKIQPGQLLSNTQLQLKAKTGLNAGRMVEECYDDCVTANQI